MSDRYARQRLLPEMGDAAQARLGGARVLCIGAGGLGCASLPYLAGAGVGHITVVDDDVIERHNLQRQVLYADGDVGRPKAEIAAQRLRSLNPDITVLPMATRLDADLAARLVPEHDIVIDGSDNFPTRYLLNDACVRFCRPLVHASATGMEAMVTVLACEDGPCLRCIYPESPGGWVPDCNTAGVLGPLVGMAGTVQAVEAIKLLAGSAAGQREALIGALLHIDARDLSVRRLRVQRREDCAACSVPPESLHLQAAEPVSEVDPAFVQELGNVLLVDVREQAEFDAGHLPGALHRPLSLLRAGQCPPLPEAATAVVYCAQGPRAHAAVPLLRAAGVGHCVVLRGGFSAWRPAF